MSLFKNKGFTLVELMIAMVIGALLVLAAMVLYVPVSRSLIDQGVISQQTLSEAINYDFDVMNSANAGYGIGATSTPQGPQVNTDLVLVQGTGPGNNATVPIPTSGSVQGNGLFWDWQSPPGGTTVCAGLQVVAGTTVAVSGNDRLVYYQEAPGGTCTSAAVAMNTNTAGYWNTVTIIPSIATTITAPITVIAAQNCDLRGSQIIGNPVLHPMASLVLPIATTLTGGFFAHLADQAPLTVCMHNLP